MATAEPQEGGRVAKKERGVSKTNKQTNKKKLTMEGKRNGGGRREGRKMKRQCKA